MSADTQRKAYRYNCNMIRPQIYSEKSLMESVVDFFSDVVPQAYSSQKIDDKEKIQWVRFENCDCSDIARNPDLFKYDTKGLPLLLILGYSNGVQIWQITPNGEALEILSVRQGPVKICRILPNPEPVLEHTDSFTNKRPLVVMCDSSSAGQPFCGMKFVSLKTGDEVHSVSFKTLPIHNIECNKRFLVVTFLEKICIYESCRFKQLFWITSCYPCPTPNVNPIALSTRWLAYADKRLVAMHQSCGGMSGDGTQSYAATVISAAKGAFKGLSMFGEAMVNSMTGCKPSSSKKQVDYVHLDNGNRPGIVTVVDIQNVHNDHFNVNEDNEGTGLIAHFHAHANEPVADMAFDPTGTLLVTACKLGHNFHIFRIMAHPCSSSLGAVHHLYTLHRGETTAKVIDISFNHDSRWITVSTHRGTTHVFAITPYGGIPNVRTHCQPFVVNRASRFHRSAGLEDIEHSPLGRRSPVLSTSPSSSGHYDRYPTLIQQNTLNNNMGNPRLPPYPHPITVYPLFQIKQPLNVVLNPGNKNLSPNHSPTGLDNIFSVASKFCTPRLCVVGSPKLDVERRDAGKRPVDCLFIMAQSGTLVEYVLEPKARSVSEKVSDESLLELNVVGRMQWNLQRLKTSTELRPPLPSNSPLILSHEAVVSEVPTAPEYYDLPGLTRHDSKDSLSSDHSGKDEDEWVSQVEIITHAGPHRRLWMGPQFSFKTYHENTTVLSSHSSALLSQSSETNMVAMDITGEEGDLESLRVQPTRSNPVSMPNARPAYRRLSSDSSPSPGLTGHSAPLLIEAGSFDQSPHLLDVYSNWTESTVEKQPRGSDDVEDDRIKETLADAMVESPMRDMEKLSLRQEMSGARERKKTAESGRMMDNTKNAVKKDTRLYRENSSTDTQEKHSDVRQETKGQIPDKSELNCVNSQGKGRKSVLDKKISPSRLTSVPECTDQKTEKKTISVDQGVPNSVYKSNEGEKTKSKEVKKKVVEKLPDAKICIDTEVPVEKNVLKSKKKKNKSTANTKEITATGVSVKTQMEEARKKTNTGLDERISIAVQDSYPDTEKVQSDVICNTYEKKDENVEVIYCEEGDESTKFEPHKKESQENNFGKVTQWDVFDTKNEPGIQKQHTEEGKIDSKINISSRQDNMSSKNSRKQKKGKNKSKSSSSTELDYALQTSREINDEKTSLGKENQDSYSPDSKPNATDTSDLKDNTAEMETLSTRKGEQMFVSETEALVVENEKSTGMNEDTFNSYHVDLETSDQNVWLKQDKKRKNRKSTKDFVPAENVTGPENMETQNFYEPKQNSRERIYEKAIVGLGKDDDKESGIPKVTQFVEVIDKDSSESKTDKASNFSSEKEGIYDNGKTVKDVVANQENNNTPEELSFATAKTLHVEDKIPELHIPKDNEDEKIAEQACETSLENKPKKKKKGTVSKTKEEPKQGSIKTDMHTLPDEKESTEKEILTNLKADCDNTYLQVDGNDTPKDLEEVNPIMKPPKEIDTRTDRQVDCLEFKTVRTDSLERSPSFESVRSTLSEDDKIVRNDEADSEVLASTEQSDSDMVVGKNKKKRKKKKVAMEESMYFEADEPGHSFQNCTKIKDIDLDTSVSENTIVDPDELIFEKIGYEKLGLDCIQTIEDAGLHETPVNETESEKGLAIKSNFGNQKISSVAPGSSFDQEKPNADDEEGMFVVKSKKSRKNAKRKSAKLNSDETYKSSSEERDIAASDKPPTEIKQFTSAMSEVPQLPDTDLVVSNIEEDSTAWETAAKITPDETETHNDIIKDVTIDNSTNKTELICIKSICPVKDEGIKQELVSMETTDASYSSSRSSEDRDLKENKSEETRTEAKNKKKRRKNKK